MPRVHRHATASLVLATVACTALIAATALAPPARVTQALAPSAFASASVPATGVGAPIDFPLFPADNPWNADISTAPVDPRSATYIASIGLDAPLHPDFGTTWDGAPNGIPYVVVRGTQDKLPATFYYADESDPGPYAIPADAPVEGGSASEGDRHVIALDADNRILYELYDARYDAAHNRWDAGSGAIWDLKTDSYRPAGWTSADAAGLPILPGLVRYDEVQRGEITHALRFTVPATQRAYVFPASHYASDSTNPALPPMGLRLRLKASVDILGFSASNQVILRALKRYGMIVADNGSPWFLSGAPDMRWNDDDLHALTQLSGRDFEVVASSSATDTRSATRPSIKLGKTASVKRKKTFSRVCGLSDPGGWGWTAWVSYGDGTATTTLKLRGTRFTLSHRYRSAGTRRISVTVRNAAGGSATARLKVVVHR